MKSTIKITLLLFIILVLTACTSTPEKTLQYNFKQGYGNLVISTSENAPPDIVYPNSEFKIIVNLENQGAYDLTNGKIKILGFDEGYFSIEENEKEIISLEDEDTLVGRNSLNPSGDFTTITFDAFAKGLFPGAESYDAYYFIKTDYNYKTELTQTVCLNPKVYETYDSGCKMEPKISLSGQGSPLAITMMEEIIYPGTVPEVEFRFTIKNKGKGDIKQVRLSRAKLANQPLNCEFKRSTNPDKRIFDFIEDTKEAILICKKALEGQRSYSSTLFLELPFTYSLSKKEKITLER